MKLQLYNTLSRTEEKFKPLKQGFVGLYSCGPTVYNYQHIGNYRTFILTDILKRALLLNGFQVNHVMNITDVGHLTGDSDEGEDKLVRAAKRERKTAYQIARFYEDAFKKDLDSLNILTPDIMPRATEHIEQQISLILQLETKGFTYQTGDGVYFDTSKLPDYGKLTKENIKGIKAGARVEMGEKRNPTDFALWKFSPKDERREMEWESPWGIGFPGWHIECSAMSMEYLGESFDIHTGGIDLIFPHHTDEIAQSEAATGKKFVQYWLHGDFVNIISEQGSEEKMAKSVGNVITLETLREQGFSPLDFRYLTFGTSWRKQLAFSWEALEAARTARTELETFVAELKATHDKSVSANYEGHAYAFLEALNNNLNVPEALSVVWRFIQDYKNVLEKDTSKALEVLTYFDSALGLGWDKVAAKKQQESVLHISVNESIKVVDETRVGISDGIQELLRKRHTFKKERAWDKADEIRKQIEEQGFHIDDIPEGIKIREK